MTLSAHKDPYENIYVVVRGHKDVILHAPSDYPWMGYKTFGQAVYRRNPDGALQPEELRDSERIPWIATDPLAPDLAENPLYEVSEKSSLSGHFSLKKNVFKAKK